MRGARCQKVLKRSKGRQRPLCRFVLKPEPCNHPRHPPPQFVELLYGLRNQKMQETGPLCDWRYLFRCGSFCRGPPRFYYYVIKLSCGFCVWKRGSELLGKLENNTAKLCPTPHGTSGEGTVRIVNSIFHSPQLRPGTILDILCCLGEDKRFFWFLFISNEHMEQVCASSAR